MLNLIVYLFVFVAHSSNLPSKGMRGKTYNRLPSPVLRLPNIFKPAHFSPTKQPDLKLPDQSQQAPWRYHKKYIPKTHDIKLPNHKITDHGLKDLGIEHKLPDPKTHDLKQHRIPNLGQPDLQLPDHMIPDPMLAAQRKEYVLPIIEKGWRAIKDFEASPLEKEKLISLIVSAITKDFNPQALGFKFNKVLSVYEGFTDTGEILLEKYQKRIHNELSIIEFINPSKNQILLFTAQTMSGHYSRYQVVLKVQPNTIQQQ